MYVQFLISNVTLHCVYTLNYYNFLLKILIYETRLKVTISFKYKGDFDEYRSIIFLNFRIIYIRYIIKRFPILRKLKGEKEVLQNNRKLFNGMVRISKCGDNVVMV